MTKRKTVWTAVPVDLTPEMLAAVKGYTVGENGGCCPATELREWEAREIWALLLAASTKPARGSYKLDPPPVYDEHYAATQTGNGE
jgi:hypothetical protein